jgi:Cupin domain
MHIPPGGGPPPHRHNFEESFIILEGEIEATFRGVKSVAGAGETVHIPANAPHEFQNKSDRSARSADTEGQGNDGGQCDSPILAEGTDGVAEITGKAVQVGVHTCKLYTDAAANCSDSPYSVHGKRSRNRTSENTDCLAKLANYSDIKHAHLVS